MLKNTSARMNEQKNSPLGHLASLMQGSSLLNMTKVLDFLSEVKVELSKVVWPTPEQTLRLTIIVVLVTVIVGFFVGGVDFLLTKLLTVVLGK